MTSDYLSILRLLAPETIVVLTALAVLAIDLLVVRDLAVGQRWTILGVFASFGCVAAFLWAFNQDGSQTLLNRMLVNDPLSRIVKLGILGLAVATLLVSMDSRFTEHIGEYVSLVLLATVGMLLMVSSEELMTIFVSLELTSLSLYILAAFSKQNVQSVEAALKYFFFGGVSAAFTLFGLSLVYGLSGSTYLRPIAEALRNQPLNPLLIAGIAMTVVGFGFKIAAAPFHLWAPDAYQGAPTPSAALIASGSKVASFYLFSKILTVGFASAAGSGAWRHFSSGWVMALTILAALSIILGNLAAIVQGNLKRLLAYSAIAHAGYALLGVAADSQQGIASLIYYTITYGLTVVGAFAVVHTVEQQTGDSSLTQFAGLSRRAPWLSFCMLVFMLSLAGIPPLAGFFGKFYLFAAAIGSGRDGGLLWLVVLAIGMSAVSLYYYLQVLKQIYVVEAPVELASGPTLWVSHAAIGLLAASVIVLGCAPDLLLGRLVDAVRLAGL